MASSKVMPSSDSRNSDLSRRSSSSASSSSANPQHQYQYQQLSSSEQTKRSRSQNKSKFASTMTVDGILRDVYDANPPTESTLLDASITLIEAPAPAITAAAIDINRGQNQSQNGSGPLAPKSVDDVWREIVSGERKEMKEEVPDEMMTLEDFLAKAGAVEAVAEKKEEMDVKLQPERLSGGVYAFDPVPPSPFQVEGSIIGFANGVEVIGAGGSAASAVSGGGRGKRARLVLEPLDKAAQQRQRRMIKNRESAARSRERKQAYQVELESLAVRLEEENERLLKEKVLHYLFKFSG